MAEYSEIQGFFSRLAAARRKGKTGAKNVSDEEIEECNREDAAAFEQMELRQEIVQSVVQELSVKLSIVYGSYYFCEHYRKNKIRSFIVKVLKEMCSHFDISFKSRDRKADLVGKIENEIVACSCFEEW